MTQSTPPTQTQHPWAAVRRTLLAVLGFIIAIAPALPSIVQSYGLPVTIPWVAGALAVAGGITRVIAIPSVNNWLADHLGGTLAAVPRKAQDTDR